MTYARTIFLNLFTKLYKVFVAFIISILIARAFGADGKGYITYFSLIIGIFAAYGHLGLNNATSYFYKKTDYGEQTISTNLAYVLVFSTIITLFLSILYLTKSIFINYNYTVFFSGIIVIVLTLLTNLYRSIYISDSNNKVVNASFTISATVKISLLLYLYISNRLTISSYFILLAIESVISILFFVKKRYKLSFNKKLLLLQLRYGIYGYIAAFLIFMNYRLDQFLIRNILGDFSLGIYSVSVTLSELVFLIPHSIDQALLGKLFGEKNRTDKLNIIMKSTLKLTFYMSLIVSFCGALLSFFIPTVYGNDFILSVFPTIILLFGVVFASIAKVSASYFYSQGQPKIQTFAAFITLLINLILNIIFIPIFGIVGAAIASTIAYTIYGVYYIIIFSKGSYFSLKEILLLDKNDISFIRNFITKSLFKKQ